MNGPKQSAIQNLRRWRSLQDSRNALLNSVCHRIRHYQHYCKFSAFAARNGRFPVPQNFLRLPWDPAYSSLGPLFSNPAFTCESSVSQFTLCTRFYSLLQLPASIKTTGSPLTIVEKSVGLQQVQLDNFRQETCNKHFVTAIGLKEKGHEYPRILAKTPSGKKGRKSKKRVKYPFKGKGLTKPVFTYKFESLKTFLKSLNVTTDELEFYPDIQEMEEEDIVECVERLRDQRVLVIFSLFLIQRIFIEIKLERTAVKASNAPNPKYWFKLRNGMYRLTSIRGMVFYLELCQLLEQPALDPLKLMDDLAAIGIYDHIETLTNKTRKLRSVGATPEDILNNLILYKGLEWFDSKIRLYRIALGNDNDRPFPVKLFLSSTLTEFKDKLNVGREIKELTKLLNVKEEDYLTCWGFTSIDTKSLVYKVHMCLKADIPKTDIFNSLGILNRISEDQCHRVTSSLRKSGHPGSVYVFKTLEQNMQHKEMNGNGHNAEEPDWTGETGNGVIAATKTTPQIDNSGDDTTLNKTTVTNSIPTDNDNINNNNNDNNNNNTLILRTFPDSSKVWRVSVFRLISHLLHLDRPLQTAMYRADINMDPTQLMDVTKNLAFLQAHGFSKSHIAHCPIVLAHPHKHLVRMKAQLESLLHEASTVFGSHSSNSSSSSPSSSSLSSSLSSSSSVLPPHRLLLSDPVRHLNVLQYFLEKETNFSLSYAHTQSVVAFLN